MVMANLAVTHIDRQRNQQQIVKIVPQLALVAALVPMGMTTASPAVVQPRTPPLPANHEWLMQVSFVPGW
jgi:hypothetical protein